MSEEEMEILKELSEQNYFGDSPFLLYADLIGKLIANYNKEKEKNKELEVINKIQEYRISVIDERELIPKSKAKEEINGKFKEAKGLYERGVQPQAQYTMKLLRDLEQSLLGKE